MAALAETALDLSAKSGSVPTRPASQASVRRSSPSPVPSMTGSDVLLERSHSVSSSDSIAEEPDSFPSHPDSFRNHPDSFPNHLGINSPVKHTTGSLPSLKTSPDSASSNIPLGGDTQRNPLALPSNLRPFKMYPFEPMTSMSMYGQMTSSAGQNAAAVAAAMYPLTGLTGHTSLPTSAPVMSPAASPISASVGLPSLSPSMFDSTAAMTLSTPIAQYLHQRKRRHDTRINSSGSTASSGIGDFSFMQDDSECPSNAKRHLASPGHYDNGSQSSSDERKDDAYWERRRKNNEAAKRSRDARRAKEEEIAFRAAYLEQENLKLRAQVAILKNETAKLHYMLYNRL